MYIALHLILVLEALIVSSLFSGEAWGIVLCRLTYRLLFLVEWSLYFISTLSLVCFASCARYIVTLPSFLFIDSRIVRYSASQVETISKGNLGYHRLIAQLYRVWKLRGEIREGDSVLLAHPNRHLRVNTVI